MAGAGIAARSHLKAARGLVRRDLPVRERIGRLDSRMIFVVGSPRSGTTFLGRSLGSLPGFVDLGELYDYKSRIPALAPRPHREAARTIRRSINTTRRLGLSAALRGVEHTPETSHVLPQVATAFPDARFVLMLRDVRDVVASFLEQGWFRGDRHDSDDYGFRMGEETRFWVEPERASEFPRVSEARRAAWAWRRYVSAVRDSGVPYLELRYEEVATDPAPSALRLADWLAAEPEPLLDCVRSARSSSIGRWKSDLSARQVADVMDEAGGLMAALNYAE